MKFNFLMILIPSLLWMGAVQIRSTVIETRCADHPQKCTKASLLPIDQLSLGMEDMKADEYSFFTQNLAGTLAIVVPVGWNAALSALGKLSPTLALSLLGSDLVVIFQTISWNGLLTEVSHLISQRPRPFVYSDPVQRGSDTAHYTSFYSGHTSFTAAATTALFLLFWKRKSPFLILLLSAIVGESLVISTAYFRVLAGRHFLTDVITGAIAGSCIAWFVAYFHRKQENQIENSEE